MKTKVEKRKSEGTRLREGGGEPRGYEQQRSRVAAGERHDGKLCGTEWNRPSRQLEVPGEEKGFGEVIKLISSPAHSPGGTGLAQRCS